MPKINLVNEQVKKNIEVKKEEPKEEEIVEEKEEDKIELDEDIPADDEDEEEKETNEEDEDDETIDYKSLFEAEKTKAETLTKTVDELSGKKENEEDEEDPKPAEKQESKKKQSVILEMLKEDDLSDDAFNDTLTNKTNFVKFLNDYGNKIANSTIEEMLTDLPGIIANVAKFQINQNELHKNFFKKNPDLATVKKYVSAVTDELIKKEGVQDLEGYEKLLDKVPAIVREKLGIVEDDKDPDDKGDDGKSKKKKTSKQEKPGGQRRRSKSSDDEDGLSPLAKDIKRALKFSSQR